MEATTRSSDPAVNALCFDPWNDQKSLDAFRAVVREEKANGAHVTRSDAQGALVTTRQELEQAQADYARIGALLDGEQGSVPDASRLSEDYSPWIPLNPNVPIEQQMPLGALLYATAYAYRSLTNAEKFRVQYDGIMDTCKTAANAGDFEAECIVNTGERFYYAGLETELVERLRKECIAVELSESSVCSKDFMSGTQTVYYLHCDWSKK